MRRTRLVAQRGTQTPEQATHLGRVGIPHGVGQAHFIGPGLCTLRGQPEHVVFGHLALQRAAECGGHAHLQQHMGRGVAPQVGNGAQLGHHFFTGLAHIGQRMGCAGRHRHGEFVHPCGQRRLGPAAVRHQRHHGQAGQGAGVAHHFGRIGHLRQQPGGHERCNLDFTHPGGIQRVDPAQFVGRGHGGFDRLQAVARADFADEDGRG